MDNAFENDLLILCIWNMEKAQLMSGSNRELKLYHPKRAASAHHPDWPPHTRVSHYILSWQWPLALRAVLLSCSVEAATLWPTKLYHPTVLTHKIMNILVYDIWIMGNVITCMVLRCNGFPFKIHPTVWVGRTEKNTGPRLGTLNSNLWFMLWYGVGVCHCCYYPYYNYNWLLSQIDWLTFIQLFVCTMLCCLLLWDPNK